MKLATPKYNAVQFGVSLNNRSMSAEASSLGIRVGQQPYGRMYDDACDVGITLYNPASGVDTVWYLEGEEYENNNGEEYPDLTHWVFKPCTDTLRWNPQLKGWKVVIFND
jgi:hypothetical protein